MPLNLSVVLRLAQSFVALGILITSTAGFPKVRGGVFTQLGSSEFNFLLLTSFSVWILTGAWGISVHLGRVSPPVKRSAIIFDASFIIALFIGGLFATISDYVSNCSAYVAESVKFLNCGVLTTAVVLTFLLMALFIATLVFAVNPSLAMRFQGGEHLNYDDGRTPNTAVGRMKDSGFV